MSPRKGLVLDANILLRAVFGIRVMQLLETYEDVAGFYSPDVCFAEAEKYAAGDYPYQSKGGDGLPRWMSADRSLDNRDVVLWYMMGITHNPRPEDWPVMPVHEAGFKLVPWGFFARNPALDLPAR